MCGIHAPPERIGHLTRQRGRWWRSFWWGEFWYIRRFSPTRVIWWLVLSQYVAFSLQVVTVPLVLLIDPITSRRFPWFFFVYICGLSYIRCARTLAVKRDDQSTASQMVSFLLLSPLGTLLNLWLCTVIQWWGMLTFRTTDWRTRQKVEVAIS